MHSRMGSLLPRLVTRISDRLFAQSTGGITGMQSNTQWLRQRLYKEAGLTVSSQRPALSELRQTEWSPEVESLMRNRLLIGAYRYGTLAEKKAKAETGARFGLVQDAITRLEKYLNDGNGEHLIDAMNLTLLEFEIQRHLESKKSSFKNPKWHFQAGDDGGMSPTVEAHD
jgi:hypothetical protein